MVDADVDVLTPLLLLLHESSGEIATSCVNNALTLFLSLPTDGGKGSCDW